MFTGIVTGIGQVRSVEEIDHGRRFEIATPWDLADLDIGASVAHAGVCLTVVDKNGSVFFSEAWPETLNLTTMGRLQPGDRINLERSLRIGDELGGHIVSGHVDGLAKILSMEDMGDSRRIVLEAPADCAQFVARKGSVCLDGTSLTVNAVDGASFDLLLIRHTLQVTTWGERRPGDDVNFEADMMARYAARLTDFRRPG